MSFGGLEVPTLIHVTVDVGAPSSAPALHQSNQAINNHTQVLQFLPFWTSWRHMSTCHGLFALALFFFTTTFY
jgi:uncharacterized membrane protein